MFRNLFKSDNPETIKENVFIYGRPTKLSLTFRKTLPKDVKCGDYCLQGERLYLIDDVLEDKNCFHKRRYHMWLSFDTVNRSILLDCNKSDVVWVAV